MPNHNKKPNRPSPTRDELQRLRDSGLTREQLGEYFTKKFGYKVGLPQIKRWISALGVKPAPQRPSRARPKKREEPRIEDGYSLIDIAAFRLGDRLTEKRGRGYYLDGRPASTAVILEAAGLKFLDRRH